MRFSQSTKIELGHYVYALIDPRNGLIFYIGKASANNRAFSHLDGSNDETRKHAKIKEIRDVGQDPRVDVLRYGLRTVEECFEIEAAIIDTIGLENLTNAVRGHGINRGRQTADEVERLHGSMPISVEQVQEPSMLFFIGKTYSPTMGEIQLYDCTRQFWYNVSERTRTPSAENGSLFHQTALAVVDSVVVRAYQIARWFSAGTTMSTREYSNVSTNKWEFVGKLVADHPLTGRRLTKEGNDLPANQNGFGYLPRLTHYENSEAT